MLDEIPWEQLADGTRAKLKRRNDTERRPDISFLRLNAAKLKKVDIISANFQGDTSDFEPYISVHYGMGATEEWLGVYQQSFSTDEEDVQKHNGNTPIFCLRRAMSQTIKAMHQFRMAPDKRTYVKENRNFESRILFDKLDLYPEISHMISEIHTLVKEGIPLTNTQGLKFPWRKISIDIYSDVYFSLAYDFIHVRNEKLEGWVERWYTSFHQINFAGGIIPDDGSFISYDFPIEEAFEQFSE